MASPAPKPPNGSSIDSAEILAAIRELGDRMERRFEKVDERFEKVDERFERMEAGTDRRFQKVDERFERMDERFRKFEVDLAEVKGRVSMLPTLWQLAGLIFAIFGASFVLIRFAPLH